MECLMLPVNWFTRAIRANHTGLTAVSQVKIEHVGGNILWALDLLNAENVLSTELLDYLAIEAGLRKLHFLKASVTEHEHVYDVFIRAGYKPCGLNTFWRLRKNKSGFPNLHEYIWRRTRTSDLFSICLLQNKLLSANERRTTPPANRKIPEYVLFQQGVLMGYAYVQTSNTNTLITPVINPKISSVSSAINSLVKRFFNNITNHYLILSDSQQWIELAIIDQIELFQPRREIMLKQIAIYDTSRISNFNHATNSQHTDIATPIRQSNKQDNNI
jgi:hypothetical protein